MSRRVRRGAFAGALTALLLAAAAPAGNARAGAAHSGPKPADAESAAAVPIGGIAYEGQDRATLRLAPALAAAVEDYTNAGYRLRRGPGAGEVTVEVSLAPLDSRAPFVPPAGAAGGAAGGGRAVTGDVARAAVTGAETVYQAVSGVLGWIVHHVSAGEEGAFTGRPAPGGEPRPQAAGASAATSPAAGRRAAPAAGGAPPPATPAQVLEGGAGDAAAIARLAVAMLGAVGIEARSVSGRVVGPPQPGAPRGRHVWIEVRYPDRGWAFSDPLHHHHYVPASYLRLSDAGAQVDAVAPAGAAELVERDDRRVPVDVYRAGGPGVGARRNDGRQVAAALRVVVPGAAEGAAVLTAADGTRQRKALLDGEGVFVGLAGGAYTLEVLVPGRSGLSRTLELAPRERSAVYFGGESAARSEPAAERSPPPPPPKQPGHARRRAPR